MDPNMLTFDAIVFPADDRPPHIVPLMTTTLVVSAGGAEPYRCGRVPHPEVYMDYIADQLGSQAWGYHVRTDPSHLPYHVLRATAPCRILIAGLSAVYLREFADPLELLPSLLSPVFSNR